MPKHPFFEDEDGEESSPSFLGQFGEEATNPLIILGDELIEELSEKQQLFLAARMVLPTDTAAARHVDVQPNTVWKWKSESEPFMKAYEVIRFDPVNFALALSRQIAAKAALEHMSLLRHPNIRVRQWAIDLAYRANEASQKLPTNKTTNNFLINFETLKQLAAETPVKELDGSSNSLDQPAEGSYRSLSSGAIVEAGRVDQVQAES